jgi:hypothetical protein
MEPDGTFPSVPGFNPGDKVWPKEGPMVLQYAPKTVIATCRHPVAGDWLWLDDGNCGFGSWAAEHWTTEEPDQAELEARFGQRRRLGEFADHVGRTLTPLTPLLPVPVDEPGTPLPDPRRWDYPLGLGFSGDIPVRLYTGEPERPSVLGAAKGDIIEVVQPDGTHEHYRVASAVPMADGIGTAFQMEAVAPDGT